MQHAIANLRPILSLAAALLLVGCGGGSRILDDPIEAEYVGPLAVASDTHLELTLDQLVVQNGPGTWARDAFWDEYRFTASSRAEGGVEIRGIAVINSLGAVVEQKTTRFSLEKASKDTKREYAKAGIELVPGNAGNADIVTPAAVAAGVGAVGGLGTAAVISTTGLATTSALAAPMVAGAAVVFAAPVLAVGGIMKTTYNEEVDDEIQARQTVFPLRIEGPEPSSIVVFLPIGPSPREIRVDYAADADERSLTVPVGELLDGLHLPSK